MLARIQSARAAKLSPSPNYDTPAGKRSQLIVVHDVESPLAQSYADTLAGPAWFGSTKAGTSAHYIVGPDYAIQMVAEEARAWHCGPAGNILSIGIEQTGYASYSRAQWTTADGKGQIRVLADLMSDISHRHGGPLGPDRASNAQIQAYARGDHLPGRVMWCTHHQITQSLGGTTHTDPDPSYPYDLLQAALDGKNGQVEKPSPVKGTYRVRRGDTLSKIAKAHGTTVAKLVKLNGIDDPDMIYVGQVLRLGSAAPKPKPPAKPYTPPPGAWPLPAGDYFGSITGPAQSHGGYYSYERKYCTWIQVRCDELGYDPGPHDGILGSQSVSAIARWQRARHAATTSRPGEVWADDWANLIKDR